MSFGPQVPAHVSAQNHHDEEDQALWGLGTRARSWRARPGEIVDDRARNYFPMPLDASGHSDVLVGRIRKDLSAPSGKSISMFVAADQLPKGAALNSVQIAKLL